MTLPQIVQDIATRLDSDLDLTAMMRTGSTLHSILHPDGANCIWRQRFLARYDYPRLESNLEFPFAYKVRQLVLRGFDSFAIGYSLKQRSGHQLDVIKDMVLGTVEYRETNASTDAWQKLTMHSSPMMHRFIPKILRSLVRAIHLHGLSS